MGKQSKEEIGGKGERLVALKSAGFNVKRFVTLDTETTRSIISDQCVSEEVLTKIKDSLHFGTCGVAIRSSAVGEDGALSWAGQFKTLLFVSEKSLDECIQACARVQREETVLSYARVHKTEVPPLALIAQEMVDAEMAGVMFTKNPVKNSDEIVIEAVPGVGESLVNGSRQPTRYVLNFNDHLILSVSENGKKATLSQSQINELCLLGKKACELFGCHQDIEWAIEKSTGNIFINQSRDITTRPESATDEAKELTVSETNAEIFRETKRLRKMGLVFDHDVLSDQNIAEILTPHPCQMAFGLFTYFFAHGDGAIKVGRNRMGYEIGDELNNGFFVLVGGQPRCSIIHDALTYRIKGIPLTDYAKIIDDYLKRISDDPQLANYPEIVLYEQNPKLSYLEGLFGEKKGSDYHNAYQRFFADFKKIEDTYDLFCRNSFLPEWRKKMLLYKKNLADDDLTSMVRQFSEIADLMRTEACLVFVMGNRIGFFAYARLRNLAKKIFGEKSEEYLNVITSGIPVELNPNLSFSLDLHQLKNGTTSLEEVVEKFGHLGSHEMEISVPRYDEQPGILLEMANKMEKDPLVDMRESSERSAKLQAELLEQAGDLRQELERELDIARRYLPLREVIKFEFLRGYDLLKKLSTRIEKYLGWKDGLIFHLDPKEIFRLVDRVEDLRGVAEKRLLMYETYRALYVPPILTSDDLNAIGEMPQNDSSVLKGIGVTNFTATGEVVVIKSLDDKESIARLKTGSILVTTTTDPAWTPLLSVIGRDGGLVTEIGGLLAHAAIYSREVKIAAVLNVPNATNLLKTGMQVVVNGNQGYVEIVKQ